MRPPYPEGLTWLVPPDTRVSQHIASCTSHRRRREGQRGVAFPSVYLRHFCYLRLMTRGGDGAVISAALPMSPWGSDYIFTRKTLRARRAVSEGSRRLPC